MAEEGAGGRLVRGLRRDGYVIGEAIVDVRGFEHEVRQTVEEVPEVEDACGG